MGFFSKPIDSLASKMAFYPPEPPSYDVKDKINKQGETIMVVCPSGRSEPIVKCDTFPLQTKHGSEILAVYLPTKRHSDPVLLYSHGNAVDLGQMLPFYEELAKDLRCNLMSYDYSGYGQCTGQPSAANTLNDISACLEWLFAAGKQPSDVVLYGQSIGSGPSVYLAAKQKEIGGLVLHSPLASGMRVLNPGWNWWPSWLDIFPNTNLMPKIECPVLIMHGKRDDVIPFSHGEKLHSLAKKPSRPLWVELGDHQNLEVACGYLKRLQEFMEEVFGSNYWKKYEQQ